MRIRDEAPGDRAAVRAVNEAAFEGPAEASLVELLRARASPLVSLVAEVDGEVVGYVAFSPVTLGGRPELRLMGLGPMAVRPDRQGRGIGSALVRAGLDRCRALGAVAVVVLGHPGYYPRFGFVPGARLGLDSEYDVPEEVFMAQELTPGALAGASGTVRYHPAFRDPAVGPL